MQMNLLVQFNESQMMREREECGEKKIFSHNGFFLSICEGRREFDNLFVAKSNLSVLPSLLFSCLKTFQSAVC